MFIKKKKTSKFFIFITSLFVFLIIFISSITPGLKGDLVQSLRIFLKQPVLLKTEPIKDNIFLDYSTKILYALENRMFNQSSFEEIKIDVKFSELEKIKDDRKKALKLNKLINPQKVNINLIYKGKDYPATARLKGDLSEHWGNIKQWSLRIKLKKNKTIFSMNEFSITIFKERDFPYNFIIKKVFDKYEIISPRYIPLQVNFNGDDWGLMLLEEQFHDSFYALNRIKEAPIFKMTNENDFLINVIANFNREEDDAAKWQGKLETLVYNENDILKKTNIPYDKTNQNLLSIFKNLQEAVVLKEKDYISKIDNFIDIESFGRLAAITAVFGDWHSLDSRNARYYLNPYDLKIKHIPSDWVHSKIDKNFFSQHNLFYKSLYNNEKFQKEYFQTLYEINNNFLELKNDIEVICKDYGKICRNLVDIDLIKENINLLLTEKKEIFNFDKNLLKTKKIKKEFNTKNNYNLEVKKINFRTFNDGEILIDNLTSENIKIDQLKFYKVKDCKKECKDNEKVLKLNILLEPSTYSNLSKQRLNIGMVNDEYNFTELSYIDETKNNYLLVERIEKSNLNKKVFFNSLNKKINKNLNKVDKNYILKKGIYEFKEPLIIPSGYNLVLEKGSNIKMLENTYIKVEDGIVKFQGTEEEPIIIQGTGDDNFWKGVYINSSSSENNLSNLTHTLISNYSYFDDDNIQLTGGINLINANVIIKDSLFKNSNAEDAVNLVNSKFIIENTKVFNSKSDAIDVDFGEGQIINSQFEKILGDAIDTSGSTVFLKNIKAKDISDKAISAGEESNLVIDNLNISFSRIGIASKDSSMVEGKNIVISNCGLFDFAAYQKKSYFFGAELIIEAESDCRKSIAQLGSSLILNSKKLNSEIFDVKKLYDGSL